MGCWPAAPNELVNATAENHERRRAEPTSGHLYTASGTPCAAGCPQSMSAVALSSQPDTTKTIVKQCITA